MRKRFLLGGAVTFAVLAIAAALFFFWPHRLAAVPAHKIDAAFVARGRYLTVAADCSACHTVSGGEPFAGGLPFKLPFGTIYAPNITPDRSAGIGSWTDAEFVRAVRQGVGRHGEDLYPAFPYTSYAKLSTDDILAIRAYLQTLKPSATPSKTNELSFPFNQRRIMRAWKLLFLPRHVLVSAGNRSAQWNRGAYLVEALAHCGECHTPRNVMFAMDRSRTLGGGEVDGWKAWNITPDPTTGIGRWSDEDLAAYLATGHAPHHGSASASMRQAVDLSLSKLTHEDVTAIVAYLRSLPAVRSDSAAAVTPSPAQVGQSRRWSPAGGYSRGEALFAGACASCHAWNGEGQQNPRAALIGDHAVFDPSGANLIRVILQGTRPEDSSSAVHAMPSFARSYSDAEIAMISNYVIGHFGGKEGRVTPDMVRKAR